jgi:hypothetical protein
MHQQGHVVGPELKDQIYGWDSDTWWDDRPGGGSCGRGRWIMQLGLGSGVRVHWWKARSADQHAPSIRASGWKSPTWQILPVKNCAAAARYITRGTVRVEGAERESG